MRVADIIIFFRLLLNLLNQVNCRKLVFVYEHVRHGARGPSAGFGDTFTKGFDEYNVSWEFNGELSAIGKMQHHYIGLRNRHKYKDLINFNKYDPKEILIHATDYNRTHHSINSELIAMYQPGIEEKLNNDELKGFRLVNQQYLSADNNSKKLFDEIEKEIGDLNNSLNRENIPIFNVHAFGKKRIFLVDDCKKLQAYRDEHAWPEVTKMNNELKSRFGDGLKKWFNTDSDKMFFDYDKVKALTDHFICDYDNRRYEELRQFQIKSGINLEEYYEFARRFYGYFIFNWFIDEKISGLEETHLMQDLLGYMENRMKYINKTTYKAPKMVMDVGHDTTVGPIARYMDSVFKVGYHKFCEFACNVFFEMFQEDDGNYTVDYYLDDELKIHHMPYEEFKIKLSSKFWTDDYVDEFCGNTLQNYTSSQSNLEDKSFNYLSLAILSTTLFIIFGLLSLMSLLHLRKLKKLLHSPLEEHLKKEKGIEDINADYSLN